MELIEIAFEVELVLGPDALQARDEFPAPAVPFRVI